MIDTDSPSGSYAAILPHCTQITVSVYDADAAWLERRLALRKAARRIACPHKRGWATRAINGSAV